MALDDRAVNTNVTMKSPDFLTERDVRARLSYPELIPAMEQTLIDFSAGRVVQPVRTSIPIPKSEGVLAMESEATVETLMHTIHAHPTIYEAVGEAFNAVYGLAINV